MVIQGESSDPVAIGALGVDRVVVQTHHITHFVQDFPAVIMLLTVHVICIYYKLPG